jgi:anti-sigma regulatory factor (Ser/Thr protein kinase)
MVHQRHGLPRTTGVTTQPVQLWLPATAHSVRYARLLAGAVADEFGFDIEEIADLRIAVTELTFLLLQAGAVEGSLRVTITTEGRTLVVRAGCEVHPDSPPTELPELVQRIVDAAADQFEVSFAGGFGGFELRKTRRRDGRGVIGDRPG